MNTGMDIVEEDLDAEFVDAITLKNKIKERV